MTRCTIVAKSCNNASENGRKRIVCVKNVETRRATALQGTEQDVAMLASILKNERAKMTSVIIMRAFVAMRCFLIANASTKAFGIDHKELEAKMILGEVR